MAVARRRAGGAAFVYGARTLAYIGNHGFNRLPHVQGGGNGAVT